jgi:hypothetical protein
LLAEALPSSGGGLRAADAAGVAPNPEVVYEEGDLIFFWTGGERMGGE